MVGIIIGVKLIVVEKEGMGARVMEIAENGVEAWIIIVEERDKRVCSHNWFLASRTTRLVFSFKGAHPFHGNVTCQFLLLCARNCWGTLNCWGVGK